MANYFFLVFFLVFLTIANGISAADNEKSPSTSSSQTIADNKATVDNSTKSLIDSFGPSQDYPDYEIPKELAPDGVAVVDDYVPISPIGGLENADSLAQPDEDTVKNSPSSSAFRSSSSVLVGVAAVAGASLFFFGNGENK